MYIILNSERQKMTISCTYRLKYRLKIYPISYNKYILYMLRQHVWLIMFILTQ
uniref:Uncharacterized protein n=1 Tax=Anguilla anguilla TaxID=7936 RepID=A0A0E9T1L9_ANGAN